MNIDGVEFSILKDAVDGTSDMGSTITEKEVSGMLEKFEILGRLKYLTEDEWTNPIKNGFSNERGGIAHELDNFVANCDDTELSSKLADALRKNYYMDTSVPVDSTQKSWDFLNERVTDGFTETEVSEIIDYYNPDPIQAIDPSGGGLDGGIIALIVISGALLIALIVTLIMWRKEWLCFNSGPEKLYTTGGREILTPLTEAEKSYYDTERRRRLATPFTKLVDELGISMPLHAEPHRVLAAEPDFVERLLSMDGIQYVLAASCITQVLWCALGYYLYKRCTAPKEAGKEDTEHQAVPARGN